MEQDYAQQAMNEISQHDSKKQWWKGLDPVTQSIPLATVAIAFVGLLAQLGIFGPDNSAVSPSLPTMATSSTSQPVEVTQQTVLETLPTPVTTSTAVIRIVNQTMAPSVRKSASISSALLVETHDVGTAIKTAGSFTTKHDGRSKFKITASPVTVCTLVGSSLQLLSAGECGVTVNIPKTEKYNSVKKTFLFKVQEIGLSKAQLDKLSSSPTKDESSTTFYRHFGSTLQGPGLTFERPAGDFKKLWRMQLKVSMPNFGSEIVNCLKLYVRYSYGGKFGFTGSGSTDYSKSCSSNSGTFETCVQFMPERSHQVPGGIFALPSDNSELVKYDWINWGIDWTTPVIDHVKAKLIPPEILVTEVRPGNCS